MIGWIAGGDDGRGVFQGGGTAAGGATELAAAGAMPAVPSDAHPIRHAAA